MEPPAALATAESVARCLADLTADLARTSDRIDALEQAVAYRSDWTRGAVDAARAGNVRAFETAVMHASFDVVTVRMGIGAAAENGHLDILRWIHESGCFGAETVRYASSAAAYNGRLDLLEWLHERGLAGHVDVAISAARGGHVPVLRWLHERRGEAGMRGVRWSALVCSEAARCGRLEALRWLRETAACPWDAYTARAAAKAGHHELLKWAVAAGCPHSRWGLRLAAALRGRRLPADAFGGTTPVV